MKLTTFNSFRNRNYRLYFAGQSVSLIGTWMQKTAVSWVIYSLTGSNFMLGVSIFATLFPTAVFSLFGGLVADRYNRFKVLLLTQVLSLVQAVLLTAAVLFLRKDSVWIIIGLSVLLGVINAFDVPARQLLVRELVADKADLPNALALNSSMVNLSKLIGPSIAGFVLEKFGDGVCFGLNAASFIPVLICLLGMKLPKHEPKPKTHQSAGKDFREAFAYISATPLIRTIIIFVGLMNFLVLPYSTLTPVFAKEIFAGSATTFGVIDGFIGLGAFIGAIYLASLKTGTDLTRVLATNTLVFGAGLMLFSHTNLYHLALLFIAVSAFGQMAVITVSNTVIQVNVPPALQGRVLSVFIMVMTAMLPLGSLVVGGLSHYAGVQKMVLAEGIIAIVLSLLYTRSLRKEKLHKADEAALENQPEEMLVKG